MASLYYGSRPAAAQALDLFCFCMSPGLAEQMAWPCCAGKQPISAPGPAVLSEVPYLVSAYCVPGSYGGHHVRC